MYKQKPIGAKPNRQRLEGQLDLLLHLGIKSSNCQMKEKSFGNENCAGRRICDTGPPTRQDIRRPLGNT